MTYSKMGLAAAIAAMAHMVGPDFDTAHMPRKVDDSPAPKRSRKSRRSFEQTLRSRKKHKLKGLRP